MIFYRAVFSFFRLEKRG